MEGEGEEADGMRAAALRGLSALVGEEEEEICPKVEESEGTRRGAGAGTDETAGEEDEGGDGDDSKKESRDGAAA